MLSFSWPAENPSPWKVVEVEMGRGTLTNMVAFLREKRKSPCSSERGTERN